jgi:hypothetical protein
LRAESLKNMPQFDDMRIRHGNYNLQER